MHRQTTTPARIKWLQKTNRTTVLLGLLMVAITAAIYMPVIGYDFVAWDDDLHVRTNPQFYPVTWSHIFTFWKAPYQHLYIPLTYTVWAALAWLSTQLVAAPTLSACLFHGCNLLLHFGNTVVTYRLGLLLGLTPAAAAVAAAAFSLHPLQVEPVVWVSGLKDVLCGWWALIAVWAALVSLQTSAGQSRWRPYWLATMAFCLALLAKPAAVVVPAIVGILAIGGLGVPWRQVVRTWGWWALIGLGWSVWTKGQQPDSLLTSVPPLWERLFIAADALWFYVGKVLWPVRLGLDYGRTPQMVLAQGEYWWAVVGVCGLAMLLLWRRRQDKILALGGAIFGISLLPMLGLVPFAFQAFSTVADRYSYLALVGVGLSAGWAVQRCTKPLHIALVGLTIVGLLGGRSMQQIPVWQHTHSLLTHALQVHPRSVVAHNNLGLVQAQRGNLEAAIAHYQQALQANPHVAAVHYNLGNALLRQGQPRQALEHYYQATQLQPTWAEAHNNLGSALDETGQVAEAIRHYQMAMRLKPQLASAHNNLGDALFKQGHALAAIEHFRTAVRLQPTWAEAHYNLAIAYTRQGQEQEAIAAYRAALSAKPQWLQAALPLAWLLTTSQPLSVAAAAEATTLAEQASRIPGAHQAVAQYTLALAYRTTGNTVGANVAAQHALTLAIASGDTALAAKIHTAFPALIEKG